MVLVKMFFKKQKEKGLHIIDASCPDVIKTHQLIQTKRQDGYEILYIGKSGHPEAEGAISIDPEHIHLISSQSDIDQMDNRQHYVITNQTTMSLYDVYDYVNMLKKHSLMLRLQKKHVQPTKVRQEAIQNIDEDVDIVFIIGDPHSNNTKKLASIASFKKDVYMIESLQDLDLNCLKGKQCAAVSSGASTPTYLTNQVIEFLKQFDETLPQTYQKPTIDKDKILG